MRVKWTPHTTRPYDDHDVSAPTHTPTPRPDRSTNPTDVNGGARANTLHNDPANTNHCRI